MNTITESSTLPVVGIAGNKTSRDMLVELRSNLLNAVDAIERCLGLEPRTAEIRAWSKRNPSEGKCNSA